MGQGVQEEKDKADLTKRVVLKKNRVLVNYTMDPIVAYKLKRFCLENNYSISGYVEAVIAFDLSHRPEAQFPEEIVTEENYTNGKRPGRKRKNG